MKPAPSSSSDDASLISTGSFDDDLETLRHSDWIIEAIVEQIEPKRALLKRVERVRRSDTIVSSNTSGIPLSAIAEGFTEAFRACWIGTHFFNPPRYLHLVELIPTADTVPEVVGTLRAFVDLRLGKGVVEARDVPGFIANRIATFGVMQLLRAVESGAFTIEEIDAITGPVIGRPKSATFRTIDLAGVDVLGHVAQMLASNVSDREERAHFELPAFVREMIARGQTGAKAGKGFYQKSGDEILTLDPATLTYRPRLSPKLPALDAARRIDTAAGRIATLYNGSDRVGAFLRETLRPALDYADRMASTVAFEREDVDRALEWGYGWEIGPLATRTVLEAAAAPSTAGRRTPLSSAAVIRRNPGASFKDLGDGVGVIEFHSKMNTIGGDTVAMLRSAVDEAPRRFTAIVVGNDAADFSAGANLMLLLLEAQEGNWDEVDAMVRGFQAATLALRYADVPVVVALSGLTLGGGCEIALHGAGVQAAAETYMGLVETGVGLIPAGGGTKEMLVRASDERRSRDLLPPAQRVFETLGFAQVSTSAANARKLGYLRDGDGITMNRDRLLSDAKAHALGLAAGYRPPSPPTIPVGGETVLAALKLGVHLAWRSGRISDHDALIGRKLAWILAGGSVTHASTISERQFMDLEREAFLSLCGERKTLDRIAHTLKTGKPLRN